MRLINRPRPVPFERLESYLERLRQANYYEERRWYTDGLAPPVPARVDLLRTPAHYTGLSTLTGLSEEALYSLTLHHFVAAFVEPEDQPHSMHREPPPGEPRLWWDERRFTYRVRDAQQMAICPHCYAAQPALLLPWRLTSVTTCPIHHVLLVDSCPVCATPLRLHQLPTYCQQCGTSIKDFPTLSVVNHTPSHYVTELIWSALGCTPSAFPPRHLDLPDDHPLYSMTPASVLWWFGKGMELIARYDPENPFVHTAGLVPEMHYKRLLQAVRHASIGQIHALFCVLGQLLDAWPSAWNIPVTPILHPRGRQCAQRAPYIDEIKTMLRSPQWQWLQQQTRLVAGYAVFPTVPASNAPPFSCERIEGLLDAIVVTAPSVEPFSISNKTEMVVEASTSPTIINSKRPSGDPSLDTEGWLDSHIEKVIALTRTSLVKVRRGDRADSTTG